MKVATILAAVFVPLLFIMLLSVIVMMFQIMYEDISEWLKLQGKITKVGFSLIAVSVLLTAINIALLIIK